MAKDGIREIGSDLELGAGVLGGLAIVQFGSTFIDSLVNSLTSRGGLAQFTSVANLLIDVVGIYFAFSKAGGAGGAFQHGLMLGLGAGFTLRGAKDIGALIGFPLPKLGVTF